MVIYVGPGSFSKKQHLAISSENQNDQTPKAKAEDHPNTKTAEPKGSFNNVLATSWCESRKLLLYPAILQTILCIDCHESFGKRCRGLDYPFQSLPTCPAGGHDPVEMSRSEKSFCFPCCG